MALGAVSTHISAVAFWVRGLTFRSPAYLGVAFQIDEKTRKPTCVEIRRNHVAIPGPRDGGAVRQNVKTAEPVHLKPCFDPVRLRRRCRD
jgi:hypothetical protein